MRKRFVILYDKHKLAINDESIPIAVDSIHMAQASDIIPPTRDIGKVHQQQEEHPKLLNVLQMLSDAALFPLPILVEEFLSLSPADEVL